VYVLSLRRGEVYMGGVKLVPTPLVEEVRKLLKEGSSVLVSGPHGVGKSAAVFTAMYTAVGEGAAAIDLSVDTATFAEYLKVAEKAKWAFGFFDALPPQFYEEPDVWVEYATLWRDSCQRIAARSAYLQRRGYPVVLVLPRELAARCGAYLRKFVKVRVSQSEDVARRIFEENAEVYCGDSYAEYVATAVSKWGEGGYYMALYAAKELHYCDEDPDKLVEEARASFVEKLKKYVKVVYAGPRFADVVAHRRLPGPLLSEVAHYEEVKAKVRVAERLVALARKIPSPHKEYVEVLALQAADGLRRFTRPGWYVRSLRRVGPLCEEAFVKAAEEQGGGRREVDLRLLLKGFVIAHNAYGDLAEAVLRLALGESPCVGKLARLCRGGAMEEELVNAIVHPYRLSLDFPPLPDGLAYYAGVRAEELGEDKWVELLAYLNEEAKGRRVNVTPFRDYVELALSKGGPEARGLALSLVEAAAVVPRDLIVYALAEASKMGRAGGALVDKYVQYVGDAEALYKACGEACKDVVVEVALAAAARARGCEALRQLEVALTAAGYGRLVEKYRPHQFCA